MTWGSDRYDKQIERLLEIIEDLSEGLLRIAKAQLEVLERIDHNVNPQTVFTFGITQENQMAITGIIPGATGTFTATPLNAAGTPVALPLPTIPTWTSSDTVNAPVVATADGLSASVTVPGTFVPTVGQTFTLTVAMADGSASSVATVPFDAVVVDNTVASFAINQTS